MKKGVILCGGEGTRLRPLTKITNKHLLPVYDKPMVLYPIETLKSLGIRDILIISGGNHIGSFAEFLGDGSDFEVNLTYKVQKEAGGIAQALLLAEDFVTQDFVVILGDNIFGNEIPWPDTSTAIVLKKVDDPQRFGVYDPVHDLIVEKPKDPPSKEAVTGIYFYNYKVFDFIKTLRPSARGELEITDVNNWCLRNCDTSIIRYKGFWSDAGTFDSLLNSTNYIHKNSQGR